MDTYRLTINNNDQSTVSTSQETSVCGFTVIKAPAGPCTPKRISAGDTATIQDIFGASSKNNPDLYEATTFNSSYDLYISAPYEKAAVPALLVTSRGIEETNALFNYGAIEKYVMENNSEEFDGSFYNLIADDSILQSEGYSIITSTQDLGEVNNGEFLVEEDTLKYKTNLTKEELVDKLEIINTSHNSYKIGIQGLENDIVYVYTSFEEENQEIKFYNIEHIAGVKHEVGTIEVPTEGEDKGKVIFTFIGIDNSLKESPSKASIAEAINKLNSEPSNTSLKLLSTKTLNIKTDADKNSFDEEVKAIIIPKYPSDRKLTISIGGFNSNKGYKKNEASSRNILKITAYEENSFHNEGHPVSFTGSLDLGAVDASGKYIGFTSSNSDYSEQELVYVLVGSSLSQDEVNSYPEALGYGNKFTLKGGSHVFLETSSDSSTSITTKKENEIYNKGWAYAGDAEYSNVNIFFESRALDENSISSESNTFFSLSIKHPLAGYIFNYTPSTVSNLTPLSQGERYWNICNKAIVTLSSKERIISPLTGSRAAMQCRIIENRWGGIAPMYLNSGTPSMGGQLTVPGIYKMVYKYSSDDQKNLDENNYNPVVMDHSYGVMCVGQKTCKAGETTDWSYIGHVCSFLTFQREVREQVMIPQLGKANNPYYRQLRAEQVNQLLARRLEGNNRIWAEATVDTSTATGCNDAAAQRAKKFIINVKVKPDIYSEYVELNFTNYSE